MNPEDVTIFKHLLHPVKIPRKGMRSVTLKIEMKKLKGHF